MLILVLADNEAEFGVTIAAIPVVLILLVLCGIAVQREIKWWAQTYSIPIRMFTAHKDHVYLTRLDACCSGLL